MWYIYTMEYYLAIKEQNNVICSNVDTTIHYHTKWSKSERETLIPYHITYMWNLKHGTNESIYKQKQTHRHRDQTCGCQVGGEEGEGWTGNLGLVTQTTTFRMDKQQGPTVEHRELYPVFWDKT